MGVRRFEDLIAWQEARKLARRIYEITDEGRFVKNYGLTNQMQRAAVSIMSNIAEGFGRANPGEFHQFLVIALGSCNELRSQLYLTLDAKYLSQEQFDQIYAQIETVTNLTGALRASVEKQKRPRS